jgi:type II protein arginine methyltransferase
VPTISPILSEDTTLSPTKDASQLVGYISPWIDLFSPDPIIADISCQVFMMEVTFAAFCGVRNIVITGPGIYDTDQAGSGDIAQYARAVQEVLLSVPSVQLAIHIPMCYQTRTEKEPLGHLAHSAREVYTKAKAETEIDHDLYESWDSWNVIRTVGQYSPRLSIGNMTKFHLLVRQCS